MDLSLMTSQFPGDFKAYLAEYEMVSLKNMIESQQRLVLLLSLYASDLAPRLQDPALASQVKAACETALREYLGRQMNLEDELLQVRNKLVKAINGIGHKQALIAGKKGKIIAEDSLKKVARHYQYDQGYSGFLEGCLAKVKDGSYERGVGIKQVVNYKDGRVYEGYIKGGKKTGQGRLKFVNGDVYDGEWQNNEREGIGKYIWGSGAVYEGDYDDNSRNGTGKYVFPDGKVYEGEFDNGARTGEATMKYPNGDFYRGEFLNGVRHGKGEFKG